MIQVSAAPNREGKPFNETLANPGWLPIGIFPSTLAKLRFQLKNFAFGSLLTMSTVMANEKDMSRNPTGKVDSSQVRSGGNPGGLIPATVKLFREWFREKK